MALKGHTPWNKGKRGIYSLEYIEKLRKSHLNPSQELRKRISETLKRKGIKPPSRKGIRFTEEQLDKLRGRTPWNKNKKNVYSEETLKRISLASIGRPSWNKNKKVPAITGANHYLWIKDRTKIIEKHRLRATNEWKKWREAVFKRDNFTCQECGQISGYLEPHHIIPIRLDDNKLFNLNNGITLCRPCHKKTVWKEEQFIEKYSRLIANRVCQYC